MSSQTKPRQPLWWTEFWLVALTATSILTTRRLFNSWDYLFVMLLLGVGSHLLLREMRRQYCPLSLAAPASAILGLLLCSRLLYSDTLYAVCFPTAETFRQMGADLSAGWFEFGIVEAPTTATDGYILAAGIGAWLIALGADSFAFRRESALWSLVPSLVLLVFVGALSTTDWAIVSTGASVFCGVLFMVTHRLACNGVPWLRANIPERRQAREPVRLALGLAAAAAIGAVVLTPLLPGTEGKALIALKELDGSSSSGARVAISPLVDARGRLVSTSDIELFRVQADAPAYWRISGLGSFDGFVWGSDRSYSDASGMLRETQPDEQLLRQVVTINALNTVWVPAAFEPVAFEGSDTLYDPETAALVLSGSADITGGLTYTVTSAINVPTVEQLRAATDTAPEQIVTEYTGLPDGFSQQITDLAQEITADADTPFERALALQNFFLENFEYSLAAPSGHDTNRLLNFLFTSRSGYCEQFAGSYAAMARTVGLPSRVAVGFTPGELVDDTYIVRGEHYHAWPEVWIGDRWVYFEPTPGRGAPRASSYTGVVAQQVAPNDPNAFELSDDPVNVPNVDDLPGVSSDITGFIDEFGIGNTNTSRKSDWYWVLVPLGVLGTLGLAWLAAVPAWRWSQRMQRHQSARGNLRAEVQSGWADLCDALASASLTLRAGETHREFGQRAVQHRNDLDHTAVDAVARTMDHACYASQEPSPADVCALVESVRELRHSLRLNSSVWKRLKSVYLPRSRS